MKKQLCFLLVVFFSLSAFAQQIPVGSCGIVHIHDPAGNRTKRLYYCNNGGTYPTKPGRGTVTQQELENTTFQEVTALYPDPTTGIFQVTFSRQLKNAGISIIDVNGKVMQQYKANGQQLTCDISNLAAGEYFVIINDRGKRISKKVIKQ
jgi:hypothetical protein